MGETPLGSEHKMKKSDVFYLYYCFVGEPMDSVCEDAGSREPSKSCHSEIMFSPTTNLQKMVAVCPTMTEVQNQVADLAPSSSETVGKDPKPFQDDRTAATPPKPGKTSNSNKQQKDS